MALVVIIEPSGDPPEHCSSIQQWVDAFGLAVYGAGMTLFMGALAWANDLA
jgi:hypothetical protein